ncbi:unnamed protein product, partial [Meganyctiphanes norvegica]
FGQCVVASMLLLITILVTVRHIHFLQAVGLAREKRQGLDTVSSSSAECVGSHEDLCLSAPCVHAASRIMKAMDTSIDPCQDFFKYACNGWIRKNEHKIIEEQVFMLQILMKCLKS